MSFNKGERGLRGGPEIMLFDFKDFDPSPLSSLPF